jgi:predicted HicB family RNase H-like nuclease
MQEIRTAVELVLEDLAESGKPMPEPLGKKSFSGNFNTRIPKHLHRRLAIEAAREGVSLNQLVVSKLST